MTSSDKLWFVAAPRQAKAYRTFTACLRRNRFVLEFFSLIVCGECLDEFVDVAFHHQIQLMNGETDAVIGDAVFLEVVSANLFRAIAGANHRATFAGQRVVLLLLFYFLQTRTQYAHRLFAVLYLRLLILH